MKRNLLIIRLLMFFGLVLLALVEEACANVGDARNITKRLAVLSSEGLPLTYDEDLLPIVESYENKPLPAVFVRYETYFEAELQKRSMPAALKFLPMALSGMKVNYAQGDRCGVWALPTLLALRHGLRVDETIDERFSIEASTAAALDFLCELHQQYQNWWFCVLAYANSPTALHHAMVKNEAWLTIWDAYKQAALPDTKVIANFMACCYVYGAEDREVASTTADEKKDWTLQRDTTAVQMAQVVAQKPTEKPSTTNQKKSDTVKYTVKRGDTLTKIANRYHVTISQLQEWNKLKDDKIQIGQKLIVKK